MKKSLMLVCIMLVGNTAFAREFFGFNVGVDKKEEVIKKIESDNGVWRQDFYYKNNNNLPIYRMFGYKGFESIARVMDSFLVLNSEGVLTFGQVRFAYDDRLLADFMGVAELSIGNKETLIAHKYKNMYKFEDRTGYMVLTENTFGVGDDRSVVLEFGDPKMLGEMRKMIANHEASEKSRKEVGGSKKA